MTFPVFLKLLRLFQVVGKIDDTLALLNLVSLSFGFCLAQLPGGCPGCAGWAAPTPRAPARRPQHPSPLPPSPQACMMSITFLPFTVSPRDFRPLLHLGVQPALLHRRALPLRCSLLRSSQATGRPGAWTTGLQRGENFPGEGPTLGFQAGRSGEASRAPGGAVGGRDQPGLQGRSEGRPLHAP